MKIALISGINGQDGSYLAELLLEKKYIVWGIIRRASNINTQRIDHLYDNPDLIIKYGDISRDDVAETLLAIIENEGISRKIIELTEGETPVREAIASVPA